MMWMEASMNRTRIVRGLRTLALLLILGVTSTLPRVARGSPPQLRVESGLATAQPHLELSVTSATARVGDRITLHITYVNLGLPYTTVRWDPLGLVAFDPPRTMPCTYREDTSGCTAITLRAQAPGMLTIHAGATGEIWDDTCACGYMSGGSDDGPATVRIEGAQLFLPLVVSP